MVDEKTGILLLSHGSRLDDGEVVIKAYKEMYEKEYPDSAVEYGFMEISCGKIIFLSLKIIKHRIVWQQATDNGKSR